MTKETARRKRLPKLLRIFVIICGSFFMLYIVLCIAASWYVHAHKQELIQKISAEASENIGGNFHIEDIGFAPFKSFPDISLHASGITLSDSLYSTYHINLIELKNVYVKIGLSSLLSHPKILNITLSDGVFHVYNLPNGYSNDYLLKSNNGKGSTHIRKQRKEAYFTLENITFNIENAAQQKQLLFVVKEMYGAINYTSTGMNIEANSNVHVHHLGFDLSRGSYLTEKDIHADFHLVYDSAAKDLSMKMQPVKINETTFNIALDFNFGNKPQTYSIKVDAPSIRFKEAESIITQNIQRKFDSLNLNFKNNIALQASIDGHLQGPDDPLVEVKWQVENNDFSVPFGTLNNATFKGRYFNNAVNGKGCTDENSEITADIITASFYNIPVKLSNVGLFNLSEPVLDFNLVSEFPANNLNSIVNNTFDFISGNGSVNLTYHGGLGDSDDTSQHRMIGYIHIANAAFTYIPNNIHFKNGNVNLVFNPRNLVLQNTTLSTDSSDITINGYANDFMDLYMRSPEKIVFNWDVNSNKLNFKEFKGLLNASNLSSLNSLKANDNKHLQAVNNDISNAMQRSSANLHIHIGSIAYKTFSAQNLNAYVGLTSNDITLKNASVRFANGNINADALINKSSDKSLFRLNTDIQNVDVSQLFEAFENFGSNMLTDKNIYGRFSSNISIGGALDSSANLLGNALTGKVSFNLSNGELKNFKPFLIIQKYLFKERDFANVKFGDIKNDFSINSGMITIPPMTISSNVIEISLSGIYGIDRGTDIAIDIPLRNPQITSTSNAIGKGIVVHLRAKDNGKSRTKIIWDLFRKKKGNGEEKGK